MKDETADAAIEEIVRLRPKMYFTAIKIKKKEQKTSYFWLV